MISHLARVVFLILEVVTLFNLLIAVHEFGHFLAAKWRGLYIEQFGIWFGKPLWQKKIDGVLYSLGSIPAGGFVKLPQLAPMDIIEGEADVDRAKLPPISALDKIIVALAGPVFSMLLALVFACIVWAVGRPVGESDVTTVIGYVMPDSSAAKVGLQPGDKILAVDGNKVSRFLGMNDSVSWNVVRSEGETVAVEFERGGKVQAVQVVPYKPTSTGWHRQGTRQLLIMPAETAVIEKVEPNTPAAAAGLQLHDVVTGYNNTPIYSPIALAEYIDKHPTEEVTLHVARGAQKLDLRVTPTLLPTEGKMKPRIGIGWDPDGKTFIAHTNPFEQVYKSITGTLETLGAVASPKSDVKFQHMSGPIGIGHIYYLLFENERGWQLALWFSVILNVNLAILNLIPIPVLDGGHIVLAILESIRRKPINIRILEYVQTGCAVMIIGYICYVSFFDIGDFFGSKMDPAEATPAPPAKVVKP
jgi:regulator of sigma E protease